MMLEQCVGWLDRFAKRRGVLMITASLCIGLVFLQAWFSLFSKDPGKDSYSYYFGAKALVHSVNPYDEPTIKTFAVADGIYRGVGPYLYPPPFLAVWRPLIGMSFHQVHSLLTIANLLLFGWALWLVVKLVKPQRHPYALLFLFLLIQSVNGPAVTCLRVGQMTPLIVVSILLCLYLHLQGRETLSTLVLALAILIKISPAILLIYFLLFYHHRWRYLAKTGAWVVLMILVSLPWAGPKAWLDFFQSYTTGLPDHAPYSIWGWLQTHKLPIPILEEYEVLLYALIAVSLTVLTILSIRNQPAATQSLYGFSMLLMLSLLIHPVTWHQHFYIWLLPGLYFASYHWERRNYAGAAIWAFLIFIVLIRAPAHLLILRPAGTLVAFLLELRPKAAPIEATRHLRLQYSFPQILR